MPFEYNDYKHILSSIQYHIVPIFKLNKDGYEFIGCSTYILFSGSYYLVTASHVVDKNEIEKYLIPITSSGIESIPFSNIRELSHKEIDVDLTIIHLTHELPLSIPIEKIENKIGELSKNPIILAGFPQSKVKAHSREARWEPRFIVTKKSDKYYKDSIHSNMNTHYFFDFKKNKVPLANGAISNFPDPNGMSGGPAIEVVFKNLEYSHYQLIGILTDWDNKKHSFIRCTMARLILLAL